MTSLVLRLPAFRRCHCGNQLCCACGSVLCSALRDRPHWNCILAGADSVVPQQCRHRHLQHCTVRHAGSHFYQQVSAHGAAHVRCGQGPPATRCTMQSLVTVGSLCRYMPDVFKAISPHYAFRYFFSAGQASWVSLNGILLCVSGSEALFADMGHFSHCAITVSPFLLPCTGGCNQQACVWRLVLAKGMFGRILMIRWLPH